MDFWIDELLDYRRLQIACSLIHQSTNPIIRQGGTSPFRNEFFGTFFARR